MRDLAEMHSPLKKAKFRKRDSLSCQLHVLGSAACRARSRVMGACSDQVMGFISEATTLGNRGAEIRNGPDRSTSYARMSKKYIVCVWGVSPSMHRKD